MPSQAKLTLYVDVISPFGYLAYYLLRNSPVFKPCEITYVPILLGGVMKATGNTPPLYIKNKDKWIEGERKRWAEQFNIPCRDTVPPGFPVPTVNAQRALCAVQKQSPSHFIVAMDTLSAALWAPQTLANPPSPQGTEYNVNSVETLLALLSPASVLGEQLAKSVVAAVSSSEVKTQLIKNTEEALQNGAFGLPWFYCTNPKGETQGFWGFDHLGQVARFLEVDGSSTSALRPML